MKSPAIISPPPPFVVRALGVAGAMTGFFVAYFYLLNHPFRVVTTVPELGLDQAMPFWPWTVVVYASLWVYVSIPAMHLATRHEWTAMMLGWLGLGLGGLLVFAVWPTRMILPDIDWSLHPSVAFLKSVDQAGNACPSLHVAFAVHAAGWMHRLLTQRGWKPWAFAANGIWCAGIILSTLTTKQHVVLDVVAGLFFGAVALALNLRYANWSERGMTAR